MGPVRAEHLCTENVDRIGYTEPVAGPVEIYMAEDGMPVVLDAQGRNLRSTEAVSVLLSEHLTDDEASIGRVRLTEADEELVVASAARFPGQLTAVAHSLRTLRAAGLQAPVLDTTLDPMEPSFTVVAPYPWGADVAFHSADHVRFTSGGTEAVVQSAPTTVVDSYELRTAILSTAHSRSFSCRAGGVTRVIDMPSVVRADEWGITEEPDPSIPWAPDGAARFHMAFTDSGPDTPRLELHGTGEDRRLLLAYEGSEHLPEPVRAALAATQIRHRNAGATPELVAHALVEGERHWDRFQTEDPYGMH